MLWSHVCNSNWVRERAALAAFPSFPSTLRQWIQWEGRLMTGQGSELRHLERTPRWAVVSFFLLTAVCSGASVEHETLMEKLNQYKKNKTNKTTYNIMVLMAFKSLQFFSSLAATNGLILEMMLWGYVTEYKMSQKRSLVWIWGKISHNFLYYQMCYLFSFLTSSIILAYLLKTFHGIMVSPQPSLSLHTSCFSLLISWLPQELSSS